jgi:hypothetical protein
MNILEHDKLVNIFSVFFYTSPLFCDQILVQLLMVIKYF